MRLDKFSNPIFNELDLFDALYTGHQIPLSEIITESNNEILELVKLTEIPFKSLDPSLHSLSTTEYDILLQEHWFMPAEYYSFNVEEYCLAKCKSLVETNRVNDELAEFKNRNMYKLLQWLKYFIDTCKTNNIVWGVGRGSSVASFILYLLDVHKIDSIKYNLDWHEFLR